jgi:son of sevenless-like protein
MKVVAIADFESEDTAALRLEKGDEIRVLQRLASGWWEGVIQDRRGFFPSTFVTQFDNSAPSSRKTVPFFPFYI